METTGLKQNYKTLRAHLTSKALSARFREQRKISDVLWKRHNLEVGPGQDADKIRAGYEMRESVTQAGEGRTVVKSELWKRIDEESVLLMPSVEVVTIDEENSLEDLLK